MCHGRKFDLESGKEKPPLSRGGFSPQIPRDEPNRNDASEEHDRPHEDEDITETIKSTSSTDGDGMLVHEELEAHFVLLTLGHHVMGVVGKQDCLLRSREILLEDDFIHDFRNRNGRRLLPVRALFDDGHLSAVEADSEDVHRVSRNEQQGHDETECLGGFRLQRPPVEISYGENTEDKEKFGQCVPPFQ